MSKGNELVARLVYDGGAELYIPPEMGVPKEGQLQGTVRDQLTELCGRVCYDSLGNGRDSVAYHAHIRESQHWSVLMHAPVTVVLTVDGGRLTTALLLLANRPGVSFRAPKGDSVRVTFNIAALLQWDAFSPDYASYLVEGTDLNEGIRTALYRNARALYALALPDTELFSVGNVSATLAEPEHPDEQWVSLYMRGSRGFSHEQVRHHHRCAVSQRSTRYVDESEADYVVHPLERAFAEDPDNGRDAKNIVYTSGRRAVAAAQEAYTLRVEFLEAWLQRKGAADKSTCRKQARGAARLLLGNGIPTEMIFSASVSQWQFMLKQRACAAADAEIRAVYAGYAPDDDTVLTALDESRYAESFAHLQTFGSPDGIGLIVSETD